MASASYDIDSDCITLTRFLLNEQHNHESATGDLTQLMNAIMTAVKAISHLVNRAGIVQLFGMTGYGNIQKAEEKRLDVIANDLMINMLRFSFTTCVLVSEENEDAIVVEVEKQGKYVVCFDPLDGASNIDCLGSIGTIFSIYQKRCEGAATTLDALQSGRQIVAAGYALYGSATMLVMSVGSGVYSFMLSPSLGEFLLTDRKMQIKPRGKIYSINEGYSKFWYEPIKNYIAGLKNPEDKDALPYSARYVGSMVADVHRTLKYGGIFLYPATKDCPKGKLRLLYECIPMAFIIEQAGGLASAGDTPILDIVPEYIHQRSPVFLGSRDDVQDLIEHFKQYQNVT